MRDHEENTDFLQHPCPLRRAGVPSFIRHAVPAAREAGLKTEILDYDTRKGHPAMPKKQLVIIRPANGLPGITGKQPAS